MNTTITTAATDDQPHLTKGEKAQVLAQQLAQALAGSEALLIHLGQTELNQVKTEKIIRDESPALALTYDQLMDALELRRVHRDSQVIEGTVIVDPTSGPRQQLLGTDVATNINSGNLKLASVDSGTQNPPSCSGVGSARRKVIPPRREIGIANVIVDPVTPSVIDKLIGAEQTPKRPTIIVGSGSLPTPFEELVEGVRKTYTDEEAAAVSNGAVKRSVMRAGIDARVASLEGAGAVKSPDPLPPPQGHLKPTQKPSRKSKN